MKARIWRQITFALNLLAGLSLLFLCMGWREGPLRSAGGWELGAEGFGRPGERGVWSSFRLVPRGGSVWDGFQAAPVVCAQSGLSSQPRCWRVEVCGAGAPAWWLQSPRPTFPSVLSSV